MSGYSTKKGFTNSNGQKNIRKTNMRGNSPHQTIYAMKCKNCGHRYGANGCDISGRTCPNCQAGMPCSKLGCSGNCVACKGA